MLSCGTPCLVDLVQGTRPDVPVLVVSMYSDGALVDECIRAVHRGQGAASPAIAARVFQRLRSPGASAPSQQLSDSQREILRLVGEGLFNREIAGRVHLSENTVKSHVQEIFDLSPAAGCKLTQRSAGSAGILRDEAPD